MFEVLAQGEMGIVIAAYLFSRGVLNPQLFSIAILVGVGLTMVLPVLVRIASMQLSRKELNGAPSFKHEFHHPKCLNYRYS
jgi:hypothetical protein